MNPKQEPTDGGYSLPGRRVTVKPINRDLLSLPGPMSETAQFEHAWKLLERKGENCASSMRNARGLLLYCPEHKLSIFLWSDRLGLGTSQVGALAELAKERRLITLAWVDLANDYDGAYVCTALGFRNGAQPGRDLLKVLEFFDDTWLRPMSGPKYDQLPLDEKSALLVHQLQEAKRKERHDIESGNKFTNFAGFRSRLAKCSQPLCEQASNIWARYAGGIDRDKGLQYSVSGAELFHDLLYRHPFTSLALIEWEREQPAKAASAIKQLVAAKFGGDEEQMRLLNGVLSPIGPRTVELLQESLLAPPKLPLAWKNVIALFKPYLYDDLCTVACNATTAAEFYGDKMRGRFESLGALLAFYLATEGEGFILSEIADYLGE